MKRLIWFLLTLIAGLIFFAIVLGVYMYFGVSGSNPFSDFISAIEKFFIG